MFYAKKEVADGMTVSIAIEDNVFCLCPVCGREVAVDLQEILSDEDADLMGTAVLCDACAREWMKEHGKRSDA